MSNRCLNTVVDTRSLQASKTKSVIIDLFWYENPIFYQILHTSHHLDEVREKVFNYLIEFEKKNLQSRHHHHPLDYSLANQAVKVLKNIFSKRSEELADYSALDAFFRQAQNKNPSSKTAFWEEFRHLFLAMKCKTGLFQTDFPPNHSHNPELIRSEADKRSSNLDKVAMQVNEQIHQYPSGLQPEIIHRREKNRLRIQKLLGGSDRDWLDWGWQCRNTIRDEETLGKLIRLSPEESRAINKAKQIGIPFGITPYYVSLMDQAAGTNWDRSVRMQVIPPLSYVRGVAKTMDDPTTSMDFMGEKWTSPVELITRRYPKIAIFKPFNTCAQICVYCQRNWEINDVLDTNALASKSARRQAIQWFSEHPEITEILITGGDPAIMSDSRLKECLDLVASVKHISRIRIGTRTPVVLPMRITDAWVELLAQYRKPGFREVVLMTHFQHPTEITPESQQAVQRLRSRGIAVYNQAVFTSQNCRRFEMVALRQALRLIGVDPYYTFNAKGKEESVAYRVPIARLIQEQTEEARLSPGLDRSDEAVFNIPRLGKNYLRNANDHQVIMVMPDGSRLYEFFPWDRHSQDSTPYLHLDSPIYHFLNRLSREGLAVGEYKSIWYYY
jgi:lysine 2,3-aminomutase